ncbi:Hypothetical predicted protein, partial [Podarcis lilfordi]
TDGIGWMLPQCQDQEIYILRMVPLSKNCTASICLENLQSLEATEKVERDSC